MPRTKLSRAGFDVYRDALNTPAFLNMLPPVSGLHGLDIGCGEGANTRALRAVGAHMTGIDHAETFIRAATALEPAGDAGIRYVVGSGERLPFADAAFDFITAFMSLMDMADANAAVAESNRVLRAGGFFQFSITHPCFMPPYRRLLRDSEGQPYAVEVGQYFDRTDGAIEEWLFSAAPAEAKEGLAPFRIPRFHRTISEWINGLIGAGFQVEQVKEPYASEELARLQPVVADTRVVAYFLHVRARKT